MPDTRRFICEANNYDPEKIGKNILEVLPKGWRNWIGFKRASPTNGAIMVPFLFANISVQNGKKTLDFA